MICSINEVVAVASSGEIGDLKKAVASDASFQSAERMPEGIGVLAGGRKEGKGRKGKGKGKKD